MVRGGDEPVDPSALRVSDAEREQVQQLLARAMVAGQITPAEYSDRAAGALAAQVRGDLVGLLDDLPGATLHATLAADVLDLQAGVGGSITRRGIWRVPPTVLVRSWVGGVMLDFSEAEFDASVVAVDLATGMCSPTFVLPDGATVDVDALRIAAGSVKDTTVHRRERGTPHVMIRGRHSFGDLTLRHPRRGRRGPLRALRERRDGSGPRDAGGGTPGRRTGT